VIKSKYFIAQYFCWGTMYVIFFFAVTNKNASFKNILAEKKNDDGVHQL